MLVPVLLTFVRFVPELLAIAPPITPTPVVEPVRVSVLVPAPVAVTAPTWKVPVPDMSSVAPAVVPPRLITRSLVEPVPT